MIEIVGDERLVVVDMVGWVEDLEERVYCGGD